jgi:succinate-semialdehyde dehydrogenase / glutarate-semialdehyde dehydrogenase
MMKDKSNAWINGEQKETEAYFQITNPASGELIALVSNCSSKEVEAAIASAHSAFHSWKKESASKRAAILEKWYNLILSHKEELATLIATEMGKPMKEAIGEVVYGAAFVKWFAEESRRINGDVLPQVGGENQRMMMWKQPIGVVVAITPWNFPVAMVTRKVAPALAAGCTVVLKPAEDTPLSALRLAELAHEAGIPAGVLNVVPTLHPAEISNLLTQHPLVRKISFTGSTPIGKLLMKQASAGVKKISLELGGNAPFIVFDDANIDKAVQGAIASKYRNSGQTCICSNRIMVQKGIYDAFVEKFSAEISKMTVGPSLEGSYDIGPIINAAGIDKVEELVAEAIENGAKVRVGGAKHERGGNFYQPTVLTGVTSKMRCVQEEIFGPVAPILSFDSEDEAVFMANNTPFGLAAYFYSSDLSRIYRVAEQLEYGMVGINDTAISHPAAPFGGVKESGIGREGSRYGLDEFLEKKYICLGIE